MMGKITRARVGCQHHSCNERPTRVLHYSHLQITYFYAIARFLAHQHSGPSVPVQISVMHNPQRERHERTPGPEWLAGWVGVRNHSWTCEIE